MSIKLKAYHIFIGFLIFICQSARSQNQKEADSLAEIYHGGKLEGESKLKMLYDLSFNEIGDLNMSMGYAEELIELSKIADNDLFLCRGYLQKGSIYNRKGDLDSALSAYFKCAESALKANYPKGEGTAYSSIADVYSVMNNFENADVYYSKAIQILRKTSDPITLASVLLNAGDARLRNKSYDSALVYFNESGVLFEQENYLTGKAYNLGNIGMVYANTGKNDLAESNINEAIRILEDSGDYYPICVYLIAMSDIYTEKNELKLAIDYAQRSLDLSTKHELKNEISDANEKLASLYEKKGDLSTAYIYYKDYIVYRDLVKNLESIEKMADERTDFEVAQKQIEVALQTQKRKNLLKVTIATAIALFLFGLLAVGLYRRNNFIKKTKQIIEDERDRSDSLLLNILPEETATELKENGSVKAKKYDSVTVLFTDFKGFTNYSEKLSPEALVETVSFYFSKFDDIIEKHGLEKIKTIGDAYMCAGGLHGNTIDHAKRMLLAALEIATFVDKTKKDVSASDLTFDIRIGINTGPVVAGVVGTKKFAYDIWGDTVNVASRMETMSEPGKINIGENTYEIVKDDFKCDYRGEIEVKNRGTMKMYFVNAMN